MVKILMDMLMLDTRKQVNSSNAAEPSYRLYACQNNVVYSRPLHFDGKLVSLCMFMLFSSFYPVSCLVAIIFKKCYPHLYYFYRSSSSGISAYP